MTAEFHEIQPPEANLDMAIDFLKAINPDGRQMLVGQTNGSDGPTVTDHKLFEAGHWEQKRSRIALWASERRNIWVLPNEPVAGATDAKDTSIGFIRAVWFDTDHKGVQAAALAAMDNVFKSSRLCFVNDSGGGIHGFGILSEKVAVTPETKALAEKVGRGLQEAFGGDAVWNINRPMRVPGTVNYLNASKRAKGRQIAPTFVIASNEDRVTLEQMASDYPAPVGSTSSEKTTDAEVAAAMADIDMSKVGGRLPEKLLKSGIMQSKLWLHGVTGEGDKTGSGNVYRLALDMRKGDYTATEFAQMACIWDKADEKNTTHRQLGRAWAKARLGKQAGLRFNDGEDTENVEVEEEPAPSRPKLSPAIGADPSKFPRRQWLYARRLIRSYMSSTVAAGGIGKTALTMAEAVSMVSLNNILQIDEKDMPFEPLRVLMWNGEDPAEELMRRFLGIQKHYGVTDADIGGRLFLVSGMDYPIRFGGATEKADVAWLREVIEDNKIDVVMVDPFVSSHAASENDNMAIDRVAKIWSLMAKKHNCAVDLVHHIRKPPSNGVSDLSVDDARGASALINASRNARVLSPMGDAGKKWGIRNPKAYFGIQHAATKANMAPGMDGASWFRHVSVDLGNGETFMDGEDSRTIPGDSVGVVEAWFPTSVMSDDTSKINEALDELEKQDYRSSAQATSGTWAGVPIAEVFGLDVLADAGYLKTIIKKWIVDGWIKISPKNDHRRKPVPCIEVVKRPKIEDL